MEYLQLHIKGFVKEKLYNSERERLLERISTLYASAVERVFNSLEPLSVSLQFRNDCIEISHEYRFGAFT